MSRLMELADAYAEKADAWMCGELNAQVVDKHRAAPAAEIEKVEAENAKLKETAIHQTAGIKHLHDEIAFYMDGLDKAKAENAKLKAVLSDMEAHFRGYADTDGYTRLLFKAARAALGEK